MKKSQFADKSLKDLEALAEKIESDYHRDIRLINAERNARENELQAKLESKRKGPKAHTQHIKMGN